MQCFDIQSQKDKPNTHCVDVTKPKYAMCGASNDCPAITTDTDSRYKGCFQDYANRVFNHLEVKTDGTKWDKSTCETACTGFMYYGIQYNGKECFCGLPNEKYDTQGASLGCGSKQGGSWSIDVYEVDPSMRKNPFQTNCDFFLD